MEIEKSCLPNGHLLIYPGESSVMGFILLYDMNNNYNNFGYVIFTITQSKKDSGSVPERIVGYHMHPNNLFYFFCSYSRCYVAL